MSRFHEYRQIIYIKFFDFKEQAEKFIAKHKKQDCFSLGYVESCHRWQLTKTKLVKTNIKIAPKADTDDRKTIKETLAALSRVVKKIKTFDDLKGALDIPTEQIGGYSVSCCEFTVDETGQRGLNVDFGLLGVVFMQTGANGFTMQDKASFQKYDADDDFTEFIEINVLEYI